MILKKKVFSGYQSTHGVSYISNISKDDLSSLIDDTNNVLDQMEDTPILGMTSGRFRKRAKGYTVPLKKLVSRKKSTTN